MKLYLDTANLEDIRKAASYGVLDGVTTNPSLIKKAVEQIKAAGSTLDLKAYIKTLLRDVMPKPVSLEVVGSSSKEMLSEALQLWRTFQPIAKNVVIKIPINPSLTDEPSFDGLRVIRELSKKRIPVNCTLVFTPEQALLAAKAGASFVSPFAGRIDDDLRKKAGTTFSKTDYFPCDGIDQEDNGIVSGIDLVAQTVALYEQHQIKTRVLAASLRNARQVREAALAGAHIATVPFAALRDMLRHHKTLEGMKSFTKDVIPEYAAVVKG